MRKKWVFYGKELSIRLIESGMGKPKLAGKLKVTTQTVNNWATGRSQPTIRQLIRISETLDVEPGKFFREVEGHGKR